MTLFTDKDKLFLSTVLIILFLISCGDISDSQLSELTEPGTALLEERLDLDKEQAVKAKQIYSQEIKLF
ncbi:MAG: hypothetical protein PHF84_08730, partial [bacterium]|nr:hypothetical protein [bacterium]